MKIYAKRGIFKFSFGSFRSLSKIHFTGDDPVAVTSNCSLVAPLPRIENEREWETKKAGFKLGSVRLKVSDELGLKKKKLSLKTKVTRGETIKYFCIGIISLVA